MLKPVDLAPMYRDEECLEGWRNRQLTLDDHGDSKTFHFLLMPVVMRRTRAVKKREATKVRHDAHLPKMRVFTALLADLRDII